MADRQQVVVVGGGPGLCDRIRLLGADITMVDRPAGYDPSLVPVAKRTVLSEYDDPSLIPLLRALHRETPFSAVLSLTEQGLLPAARIAEELGVPGLPTEVVARTRDKFAMRTRLRDEGFSTAACSVVRSAADVRDFAAEHGYPVIVKPRHGKGSEHVACFRRAEDVVEPPVIDDDFIAEPFFPGDEVSVEAFSSAGEHHVIAITGKITQDDDPANPFVEIGHVVPAPVGPETAAAVAAYVSAFLDVMGITDGCTHTELRLTPSGPEVVETHTRVGGDSIPTLVRQATGYDLLDLLVDWSLRRARSRRPEPAAAGAAAIRYFTPPPGRVLDVGGVQRWQGLPGVLKLHLPLKAGDRVPPIRDSRTRVGYVLATSSSAEQAVELCRRVVAGVRIELG
ncbi:ATP-grasp domain-containing protein [Streptomyces sp. NPDC088752]|uniref:ATP-grasp domain-containing protein n=1 Tax=Streptomyces sp. NPDC088752 TaxID=3154963 RepID=UPI00343F0406